MLRGGIFNPSYGLIEINKDEKLSLSVSQYLSLDIWHKRMAWKGALPPYRERYLEESDISSHSFDPWSRMESSSVNL